MTSFLRTFKTLCRTPLVRQPSGPLTTFELSPLSSTSRPTLANRLSSRPTINNLPTISNTLRSRSFTTTTTLQASDKGKMELYSDESGSTGAGIDDVAKTDAAYDTSKGPEEAAEGVEREVGPVFRSGCGRSV